MSFLTKLFTKKIHVVTHNATFHADDIFSVALLDIVYDGHIKVTRSRDAKIITSADIVVDTGSVYDSKKNRYDHHQPEGAGDRGDGIPYASCGLIWKHFGRKIVPDITAWTLIDTELIKQIDATDNAVELFTSTKVPEDYWDFDKILKTFNPKNRESKNADTEFMYAVRFIKKFLLIYFEKVSEQVSFWDFVEKSYASAQDKRIIVLSEGGSWFTPILAKPEPLFVIYPSQDKKTWHVRGVPQSKASFEVRRPLPDSWRGKNGAELADASGVSDAVFCHRTGYLATAKTLEGAIKLAKTSCGQLLA